MIIIEGQCCAKDVCLLASEFWLATSASKTQGYEFVAKEKKEQVHTQVCKSFGLSSQKPYQ